MIVQIPDPVEVNTPPKRAVTGRQLKDAIMNMTMAEYAQLREQLLPIATEATKEWIQSK